ncbi:MAG TPA: hypothetical protein EYP73_02305, partial [Acidimicrobiia bacterium]|nr:hypothetical protein [Acidimicrobiia bacterium]
MAAGDAASWVLPHRPGPGGGDQLGGAPRRGGASRRARRRHLGGNAVIDPITLEVARHRFAAIADEMGLVLRRTSLSPNIKERA